MTRRRFLGLGGPTVMLAAAAGAAKPDVLFAHETPPASAEQRVAAVIKAYDAQGNHRTATDEDKVSADWLSAQVRRSGLKPALEPFAVSRVDPQSCYVRAGGRRLDGVPLFDAAFTDAEGVRGTFGPFGSDTDIGLVESPPSRLTEPGSEQQRAALSEMRSSRHKAVVLVTRGPRPGLFLLNAPLFTKPFGPPSLQVSSAEREWLEEVAKARTEATLVVHVARTPAHAVNVTARIAGRDPKLAPLVVSTPRSGWWQCASERGGGLACWLEIVRVLSAGKPARECLFAAFSAHELGGLGIDAYLGRRHDLVTRAHAWLHFGANIGAARQPNMIQASDDALEQWAVAAMDKEGLPVNRKAARGATPFGEAAKIYRGGGRYIAPVCDSDVFHSPADRWPDAVDVALLARYARAFANGALELSSA